MTPRFVYNHQAELGAIRLSTGPKARPVAHDFSRPVRGAGDHGQAAGIVSMRASPNASATEGRTSRLPEFSASSSCSCGRQPGEEDVRDADLSDRLDLPELRRDTIARDSALVMTFSRQPAVSKQETAIP